MSILELEDECAARMSRGRISVPLWWLPRLLEATPEQRARWQIMPFGDAIEWPEIDEHVSVKGLLRGKPAPGAKPLRPDRSPNSFDALGFAFLAVNCDKPRPVTSDHLRQVCNQP